MITNCRTLLLTGSVLVLLAVQTARSAVTIIDSFVDPFDLSARGITGQLDMISSELVAVRAAGGGGETEWFAVVLPGSGEFTYTVDLRGAPVRNAFLLGYSTPQQALNLLGYSAFQLQITGVIGQGHLQVAVSGQDHERSVEVPITSAGTLVYPFSNINTGRPFDQLGSLDFWLIPDTADFSVTIDEIAVIPEPSLAPLAVFAMFLLAGHRQRR